MTSDIVGSHHPTLFTARYTQLAGPNTTHCVHIRVLYKWYLILLVT